MKSNLDVLNQIGENRIMLSTIREREAENVRSPAEAQLVYD